MKHKVNWILVIFAFITSIFGAWAISILSTPILISWFIVAYKGGFYKDCDKDNKEDTEKQSPSTPIFYSDNNNLNKKSPSDPEYIVYPKNWRS
jgi:hypothetical protein